MHHTLTATILSLCLAAITPSLADPPASVFRKILGLEQTRSLGGGELAGYLTSPDERIATRAALAIGRTRLPEAAFLLDAHLKDPRVSVRAMSIYGLGLIGKGTQSTAIVAALEDSAGAVRIAALDALGRYRAAQVAGFDDAGTARAILQVLGHDRDPIVRARAAITLAYFAKDTAVAPLIEERLAALFAKEHDPVVRVHIMWSIFWGYAKIVPRAFVAGALEDPDENVRTEAVRAYARWNDAETIARLTKCLHDPSWHVQEQAMLALGHLKGDPPINHFTEIPAYVHLPVIPLDPFASVAALARTPVNGKLAAPAIDDALLEPSILPQTASDMTGPAPGPHPRVRIVTTKGNIYLALYPEWAPMTVASFLNAVNAGYYDDNRWFRVVPNFVVQTGDPSQNGDADSGFTIGAEENPLEQRPFIISMGMHYNDAGPARDSAGTQYYVTLSPQFHLNHDFTVFGAILSGQAVLAHLVESDRVIRIERLPDVDLP